PFKEGRMLVTSISVFGFLCTTPAANSWRTPPSRPLASARSRASAIRRGAAASVDPGASLAAAWGGWLSRPPPSLTVFSFGTSSRELCDLLSSPRYLRECETHQNPHY